MKQYKLYIDGEFINPQTIGELTALGEVETIVAETGKIKVNGHLMSFLNECIPPGTAVLFRMSNWGIARIKSEVEDYQKQKEIEREKQKERIVKAKIARRDLAIEFHSNLNFPWKYHVGIKENLSGLSCNSSGNGYKSNTVKHMIIDEDFKIGRLSRKAGDFLCYQSKSKFGANWSGTKEQKMLVNDGINDPYMPKVTCKSCLKIIERVKKYNQ